MAGKSIRIFIASSSELKEEREKCVLLINQLQKNHPHLDLEPVEWEYDLPHSNYPGAATIQDAINPLLGDCQIAVFLFYSRIGLFTRQEFELATREKKKLFVFFKAGYSPRDKHTNELFGELLEFKAGLTNTVLPVTYKDPGQFEHLFFSNLNLELSQQHALLTIPTDETAGKLSQSILELIHLLTEKEKEIAGLKEALAKKPDNSMQRQLAVVEKQKEEISQQLQQSQDIIRQQKKDKKDLEQQLMRYEGKDQLKQQALEEVEKRNYDRAEALLMESARESITQTAATFFELAKIKKLQLQYMEAMNYYELAVKIDPGNADFLDAAGSMANQLGYYDKAIAYYESLLDELTKTGVADHYKLATLYDNLRASYYGMGDAKSVKKSILLHERSEAHFKATYCKAVYGEAPPDTAMGITTLGCFIMTLVTIIRPSPRWEKRWRSISAIGARNFNRYT